jgi:hypothetical protein
MDGNGTAESLLEDFDFEVFQREAINNISKKANH